VTTLPSRPPRSWNGEGEVLGVVQLLRAEGGEEECAMIGQAAARAVAQRVQVAEHTLCRHRVHRASPLFPHNEKGEGRETFIIKWGESRKRQ